MKKKLKRKKTPFPSSFHISNEGKKPAYTPSPSIVKQKVNKIMAYISLLRHLDAFCN